MICIIFGTKLVIFDPHILLNAPRTIHDADPFLLFFIYKLPSHFQESACVSVTLSDIGSSWFLQNFLNDVQVVLNKVKNVAKYRRYTVEISGVGPSRYDFCK